MIKAEVIITVFSLFIHVTLSYEVNFDRCDKSSFYSLLENGDETNQKDMHSLIKSMHRNVLPYTSSKEDVWDALIDVDGVDVNSVSSVPMIYKNVKVSAYPYGTSDSWNREHLWPKSRGVYDSGPDFTDLHHLRPADWNVNSARSAKLFAACGVANDISECSSPAHIEAPETEADRTTFLPPPNVRGDIARALMYMSTRYDGSEKHTNDLKLADCDLEENIGYMGYRSQLLEWHEADPVDENEVKRNNRICERWQGNRNPFVDFPELAKSYFGTPYPLEKGIGYDCSVSSSLTSSPVVSPTMESPPATTSSSDSCKGLTSGDIIFTGFRSANPDIVVLATLVDISPRIEIYLTDNAWTGYDFRYTEGIQKLIVPDEGIKRGSIFGYGDQSLNLSDQWQTDSGSFSLATAGDNMHLFCLRDSGTPLFLSSLIYNGIGWSETNEDPSAFSSGTSALPSFLSSNCDLSLPMAANYYYNGKRDGKKSDILKDFSNPTKWEGSNDPDYDILSKQSAFSMITSNSASSKAERAYAIHCFLTIVVLFLMSIVLN